MKHKLSKKILPSYKSKTYVTSNFVDQLFTKFKSVRNIKMNKEKGMEKELDKDFELDIWKKERKFIADSKTKFFGVLFNNINQNLKKRNLEPIFSIKKGEIVGKKILLSLMKIKPKIKRLKEKTKDMHLLIF